jgi:hypothetical protein
MVHDLLANLLTEVKFSLSATPRSHFFKSLDPLTSKSISKIAFTANLRKAWWLFEGYQLEFLGNSTFVPNLWAASTGFFIVNMGILGVIISDVLKQTPSYG